MTLAHAPVVAAPKPATPALSRPALQRCGAHPCAPGTCSGHAEEKKTLQRACTGAAVSPLALGSVESTLTSPGQPLPSSTRTSMESRFGHDFSAVRIHTGPEAERSAGAVGALAYTVGRSVVFGAGRYRPETTAGRALLAHELTHVVQQGGARWRPGQALEIDPPDSPLERDAVTAQTVTRSEVHAPTPTPMPVPARRTSGCGPLLSRASAAQVDCAPGPLNVPGPPPLAVADPVGVITTAETTAQGWLDEMISEIAYTQGRIVGGAPLSWPTISDALWVSLRIIGINPTTRANWTGAGSSVGQVLANLRTLRAGVGAATLRYTCLGPQNGTIGTCTGAICAGGNVVVTCPGARRIMMCDSFWRTSTAADQAARMVHENAHRVLFIQGHAGRRFNPECFARMVQYYAGVTPTRPDLCPAVPEETP